MMFMTDDDRDDIGVPDVQVLRAFADDSSVLDAPRGSVVVPRRNTRGVTEFCLVVKRQHPLDDETFEFPSGGALPGETFAQTAQRELYEVAGYRADPESNVDLGPIWPHTGILRTDLHAVMFTVADGPGADGEETRWLSAGLIDNAIIGNTIICGLTLAAWAKARAAGVELSRW